MLPTSEPAGSPSGIVAARPRWPRAASARSTGRCAAWSGVRPPSSSTGSSAQPSGTHTTYFMALMMPGVTAPAAVDRAAGAVAEGGSAGGGPGRGPRVGADERLDGGEIVGGGLEPLGPLE